MSVMTPPPVNAKPQRVSPEEAVRELQERLQETRQRLVTQRTWIGICLIAAGFAVGIFLSAVADYLWELSTSLRATWLLGCVASAGIIALLVRKHWINAYTLSNTAADTEQRLSQFGQRLRTTLDYEQQTPQPAAASPSLLKALHVETQRVSTKVEWDEVIDPNPLWRAAGVGFVIAAAWFIALLAAPEFRISTARAFAIPVEYTAVAFTPQHETVKLGESVVITANVTGRPVATAELRYRPAEGRQDWKSLKLVPAELASEEPQANQPDSATVHPQDTAEHDGVEPVKPVPLHGKLVAKLSDLKQDMEFAVMAGPRGLPRGSIRVLQPLKLEKHKAHIVPPSYTGLKAEFVSSLSLKVLEGSNVEVILTLNRNPAEASMTRMGPTSAEKDNSQEQAAQKPVPSEIPVKMDGSLIIARLNDLRDNASFLLTAKAADGMTLDPVKLSIRVQMDRKPQLQFIQPEEELVVTPTTEVPFVIDASDDIGLHKVGIMYQLGSGSMKTLVEQPVDGSAEPYRLDSLLMLEDHDIAYPDAITYYAFAEDSYFGKPRRTVTPLRYIDIRPYKLEFQTKDGQGGEGSSGSSVTLEELIVRQRQNLSKTFALQDEARPEKSATERLLTYQQEILDATSEFTTGLIERGAEVPSLQRAVKQMGEAVGSLETPSLAQAAQHEQKALDSLIETRKNLRKLLNQSQSQSASACRKFDRQQRQKLRMPEKKQQDKQEQLASARAKLEELAKRERKWSQEAKTSCQNPSSSSSQSQSQSKPSSSPQSQSQQQQQQNQSPQNQQAQQSQQSQQQQSAQQSSQTQQNSSQSNQESKANSPQPTPAEVAAAQQKLQAELAELQKEIDKLSDRGKAADQQAKQAAESMQQGLEEIKKQNGDAAAKAGERSAEQLEQLSEHLAAMNSKDFGQRLEQAQKLAQQLADRQESVAKDLGQGKRPGEKSGQKTGQKTGGQQGSSGSEKPSNQQGDQPDGQSSGDRPDGQTSQGAGQGTTDDPAQRPLSGRRAEQLARDERNLATQTEMLADLLERLKGDAAAETGGVGEKLRVAQSENPPRDIAADMRQAADDLQAARTAAAGRGAAQARDRLDELSKLLGAARGEYAQPQLKELMELEEQLAQLQKQLQRGESQENKESGTAEKWQQIEPRLDQMAQSDQRLAEALQQLREGKTGNQQQSETKSNQAGAATQKRGNQLQATPNFGGNNKVADGFYPGVKLGKNNGLYGVSKVLQAKIQEAILAAALLDADQPVPPAYKELVEKYYRTLSDDLK